LRVVKVTLLSISDFVEVRSRGSIYSLATVTVDGVKLAGLHLVGGTKPNSGSDVLVVLRGPTLASRAGWRDPISGETFVVIPKIMAAYPLIVMVGFPLFVGLFLAVPHYQWLWFSLLVLLTLFLQLLPTVGWPGVARALRRHQAGLSPS